MIIDIIQNLGSGKVLVKAVIYDQGGRNCTRATKLRVTPDGPFFHGRGSEGLLHVRLAHHIRSSALGTT